MTTNKPEIRASLMQQDGYEPYVSIGRDSNCSGVTHPLIRLSDYEALQAECEKLRAAIRRLCNIYVVDDYYDGQLREERLDRAVNRAIEEVQETTK